MGHRRPSRWALAFVLATVIPCVGVHEADAARARRPDARLTVTQDPTPPVTVRAAASASSNRGPAPIASYRFDFGDGSPIVVQSASNPVATHTYGASGGTFTVLVTVVNTANLSATASASIVVVPEGPPVARLSVAQVSSPFFTVRA